jgi:hypothetical protein
MSKMNTLLFIILMALASMGGYQFFNQNYSLTKAK